MRLATRCISRLVSIFAIAWATQGCADTGSEDTAALSGPEVEERTDDKALPPLPPALSTQVRTYLEQYGTQWPDFRFHGAVLIARGDQIAVDEAFGYAGLVEQIPNETSTEFQLGTLSAQLVAAAVIRLAEQGVLDLDDPIAEHLPTWPHGESITIMHLLTHQSGIPNFTDSLMFNVWKRGPRTLDATLALFRDQPLQHDPGTQTQPSNSNYVLLGAIIEAVTGSPHELVVAEQVLGPLHMTDTRYASAHGGPGTGAIGMLYNEDETLRLATEVHPSAFGPAGGWSSTTGDLLRWVRGLRDDRLLSPTHTQDLLGLSHDDRLGYAWSVTTVAGREATTWPGLIDGFSNSLLYIPEDDTTIIVLSNAEVIPAGQLVDDIAQLVYRGELGIEVPARVEPADVPVDWAELRPLVGTYHLTRGSEQQLEGADADAMVSLAEVFIQANEEHLTLVVPAHGNKRMHPLGKGRFFFKDAAGSHARVVWRIDRPPVLVLESGGTELRFVKAPEPTKHAKH